MVIIDTRQVSVGVYKITLDGDLLFFTRTEYLTSLKEEDFVEGFELNDEQFEELTDASLTFACESKATQYLARAEQSYFGLQNKLLNKGFKKEYIIKALNYLKSIDYLSDYRFSKSWLNSRKINHFESRNKLFMELQSRGINKIDAEEALKEFFDENSEEDLCRKDFEKQKRLKKDKEKIIKTLISHGFSYNLIKKVFDL